MTAFSVFVEGQTVIMMQKLSATIEAACGFSGDLSLGEYALLVIISESSEGVPLKEIESGFKRMVDPQPLVELLILKELIQRIRSTTDRRGFALKVTSKGRARISLVDESIAAAVISANKEWSESEFEYLVMKIHKFSNAMDAQKKVSTLFSGVFLLLVFRYHQMIAKAAAHFAMTSLQAALLYVYGEGGETLIPSALASQTNMPLTLVEQQTDDLVKKGFLCTLQPYELTEKGQRRVDDLTRVFLSQEDSVMEGYSDEGISVSEELGEYCLFLYAKQSREADNPVRLQFAGQSFSQRIFALSALFSALAHLFSYPSREQLTQSSVQEFCEQCLLLVDMASIDRGPLDDLKKTIEDNILHDGFSDGQRFRAEYTRLFITPPVIIKLKGSYWINNRTEISREKGEEYAVKQVYRQLGLKNQTGTVDPPSHLVSELDYLHYVTRAEAKAWEDNDVANAHEWRKLSNSFLKHHFTDLALGVSTRIQEHSNNSLMLFRAALLHAVTSEGLK